MSAPTEKTRTPGVYKRGSRYVVVYRDREGRQRWAACSTYADARATHAAKRADLHRGELQVVCKLTLEEYAREWIGRYQGRGTRGFRAETRTEYRRLLETRILPWFPARRKLTEISAYEVSQFAASLQGSPRTIRNTLTPLKACLATAVAEGLIRANPARDIALPAGGVEDAPAVKAMSREELARVLALTPAEWQPFFGLLASTGLRVSEAIGLQWQHLDTGEKPHVKVRRRIVRGNVGAPKSKHGKRDVPISRPLADEFECRRGEASALVFAACNGSPLNADNLRSRVLAPLADTAGVPWIGFHTFRHTCATLLFADGRNAVQVQRWLGHHSPAFTLATYVHLLDEDLGGALSVAVPASPQINERDAV